MEHYEDIIYDENGKTKCNLCRILIEDKNHIIDTHLQEYEHKELYLKRLMLQNNIVITENSVYCYICKCYLRETFRLIDHINNNHHQQSMEIIKNEIKRDGEYLELSQNLSKYDKIYCSICDYIIDFTLKDIKVHIESQKHRKARSIIVQHFNGIFSVEGSNEDLWCKVCQIYFENYVEVLFEHVDENAKHKTTMTKILRLIDNQNITIKQYLTNPKEDKAFCKKCDIQVPCNVDNLQSHIKGKRHTMTKVSIELSS